MDLNNVPAKSPSLGKVEVSAEFKGTSVKIRIEWFSVEGETKAVVEIPEGSSVPDFSNERLSSKIFAGPTGTHPPVCQIQVHRRPLDS